MSALVAINGAKWVGLGSLCNQSKIQKNTIACTKQLKKENF